MAVRKPDGEESNGEVKQRIETISLDKKEEESPTIRVNFSDEDFENEFASASTKINKDEEINPNTSADDIKNQVLDYEKGKSSKMEYKDLLKTAEFLINLIDTAISTGLNFLAKDSSISAYAMPKENKKLMTEQLALILSKYQSKFSVEFLFFSGLLVLYAPLAVGAVKNRKKEKKSERRESREENVVQERKPNEAYYRNDSAVSSPVVEVVKEVKIIEESQLKIPKIPKRRPGKQPKAN